MAKFILILFTLIISFSVSAQVNSTKQSNKTDVIGSPNNEDTIIYEVVDSAAHFPGGKENWYKYIAKKLKASVGVDNGAPTGTFNVKIKLTVLKDGTLQDFKPETNYGYGFEEETIRTLKLSPKWVPAMKNGVPVNSTIIHTQVFRISSE